MLRHFSPSRFFTSNKNKNSNNNFLSFFFCSDFLKNCYVFFCLIYEKQAGKKMLRWRNENYTYFSFAIQTDNKNDGRWKNYISFPPFFPLYKSPRTLAFCRILFSPELFTMKCNLIENIFFSLANIWRVEFSRRRRFLLLFLEILFIQ